MATAALVISALVPASSTGEPLDATFQHPLGFYFLHPSRWREQPLTETMMALIPEDVGLERGQPAEIFLVAGEDAGGIENPGDPALIAVVAGKTVRWETQLSAPTAEGPAKIVWPIRAQGGPLRLVGSLTVAGRAAWV